MGRWGSRAASASPSPQHPFYPVELDLANYVPNDWDVPTLVAAFFAGWVLVLGVTDVVAGWLNPRLQGWNRVLVLWFVLWYFALNHARMVTMSDFFGQLWKEYALSDSRYMSSDSFTLCMEAITAICWGPLSYLTAYLIATDSPYRHPLQAFVSTGQLYGDVLYYATSFFSEYHLGLRCYRPEPFYYWVYFIFLNSIWIVVPSLCVWSSAMATARSFKAISKLEKSLSANRAIVNGSAQNGIARGPSKKTI